MATQNSNNNDVNVSSLFPINITTVDAIAISGGDIIGIAGTNGTTIQDNTFITLTSDEIVTVESILSADPSSINIQSLNGGISIEATTSMGISASSGTTITDGTSVTINSSGNVSSTSAGTTNIVSNYNGVAAIGIGANGTDPSTTLQIGCALGTGDQAVLVYAEGGGISIQANTNVNIDSTNNTIIQASGNVSSTSAGTTVIISNDTAIGAIQIAANGNDPAASIILSNAFGTSDDSIELVSDSGGITLQSGTDTTISAAGVITLSTISDGVPSISIISNGGPDEVISINSVQGTSYRSVQVVSDAGGVLIEADGSPGVAINSGFNIGLNAITGFVSLIYANQSEGLRIDNSTDLTSLLVGSGSPQGVLTPANQGSLYIDVNGGGVNNLYTNSDGTNTGWYNIVATQTPGSDGFVWNTNTGAGPFALVADNGYFANFAGTVAYTLPTTAAVGDTFAVYAANNTNLGLGTIAWTITQNAGQYIINAGGVNTTTGAGHGISTLATTPLAIGVGVYLVCFVANTGFMVTDYVGTIGVF